MQNYEEAIDANIVVHSAMADKYNTVEPQFKPESIARVKKNIELIIKGKKINTALDLGCGTGFMIDILKPYVKEITGVDVTQAMLDQVVLSSDCNINLIKYDTGSVELPSNYYDIATAYSFLDHLYEMEPTLRNTYKCLKRGGILYADLCPNYYFWESIKNLDKIQNYDSIIEREIKAINKKGEEIEEQFGVKKEIFIKAEHQKHIIGGLREESLNNLLKDIGFINISFLYHWYIGQAQLVNDQNIERKSRINNANIMHQYLTKSLPLSRHLFKYIGFIATKP